jgi:hypothetical protein
MTPSMSRAEEIIATTITITIVPLVAAVLGLFGDVRGLGG